MRAVVRRLEWMAVGWGGVMAGIGLLASAERNSGVRLVAVAAAFGLGGFLAGVRAEELRPLHAAAAAAAAYVFHAAFVVLGHLADAVGGPAAPRFMPGDNVDWGITAAVGLVAAILGGLTASARLSPGRRDQNRRRPA